MLKEAKEGMVTIFSSNTEGQQWDGNLQMKILKLKNLITRMNNFWKGSTEYLKKQKRTVNMEGRFIGK